MAAHRRTIAKYFALAATTAFFVGCAQVPTQEMSDARQAITAAGEGGLGGERYVWLGTAERSLRDAEAWLKHEGTFQQDLQAASEGEPHSPLHLGGHLPPGAKSNRQASQGIAMWRDDEFAREDAIRAKANASRAQSGCCANYVEYWEAGRTDFSRFYDKHLCSVSTRSPQSVCAVLGY